jgi:hypothetical protein
MNTDGWDIVQPEESLSSLMRAGGPAAPLKGFPVYDGGTMNAAGATMRDVFAAEALNGLVVRGNGGSHEELADEAFKIADAMLLRRRQQ